METDVNEVTTRERDALTGHNQPPTDEQAFLNLLQERHPDLVQRKKDLLDASLRAPKTIDSDATAGKFADFIKQMTAFEKACGKTRAAAKEPYLEGGRLVDHYFKVILVEKISEAKQLMTRALTIYQTAKADAERKARAEAERKAREEAERAAREAAEKAKLIETDAELEAAVDAEAVAEQAAEKAREAEAARDARAADLSRQRTGASTARLQTSWRCTSFSHTDVDLEALRPFFTHDAIEKAIRAFIKQGGRELAGATIQEVSRTVVS